MVGVHFPIATRYAPAKQYLATAASDDFVAIAGETGRYTVHDRFDSPAHIA
jgi:hypothetical protein